MNSLTLSLADVLPERLARARATVVELHPSTAAVPGGLPAEGLTHLRARIAGVSGTATLLHSLALQLTPREVRSLVIGLQQWEELRPAVGFLLRQRMSNKLLGPLWRGWQHFPLVAELRTILSEAGERFGWEDTVARPFIEVVSDWVTADAGPTIRQWLEDQGLSFSDLPAIEQLPLAPDTPLLRLVRDAVMMQGSAAQLRREGPKRLLPWQKELGPEQRIAFARNYLVRVPHGEWHQPLLEVIERICGLPKKPRLPAFWRDIPEDVKREFQRRFIREKLRRALGHDHEREVYWQRWGDHILDVEDGSAGAVPFFILELRGFGVVEFTVTGNAAYLYSSSELDGVRKAARWASTPADLKKMYNPPFDPGNDNRIIHNGVWQNRATQKVKTWMRQLSR